MLCPSYIILRIQRLEGKNVDLDKVAHHEPHQDLHCLQIQLFSSMVLKELKERKEEILSFKCRPLVESVLLSRKANRKS